jgi:hypothetical protein
LQISENCLPIDKRATDLAGRRQKKGSARVNIRYNIDADTGLPHIYAHGVVEDEVEDVLRTPLEKRPGERGSRVLVGRTAAGRVLRVAVALDPDGEGAFVITAYELRGKALKAFRRRTKKRGQP